MLKWVRNIGRKVWRRIVNNGEWQLVALALFALCISGVFNFIGVWTTSTRFLFWMGVLTGLGFYLSKSIREKIVSTQEYPSMSFLKPSIIQYLLI